MDYFGDLWTSYRNQLIDLHSKSINWFLYGVSKSLKSAHFRKGK